MTTAIRSGFGRSLSLALAAILPVVAASLAGQYVTFPNLTPWYASLAKPSFNPPNAVFGPVWTVLYILMAFAAWRILRLPPFMRHRRMALALFYGQLGLNALWSFAFFGAHSPLLGLVVIIPLLAMIVATIATFRRLDAVAAWCLVPYLAWVSFATVLNASVWWLNA
ncbi:TspO/MBR family protein [Chelatococcus asaccharovorans]|uniref:TspO/MBR family protein n=1 Tax=Chelatococcus asaccharovorans TaxID=28210 RepID=UPI00224C6A9D|nr:TspO/MBR family protein [Chelatococcus asaccharovorans]CAH1655007.1 Tryptophan-rich protein TspO [Chelatococcus asaccharovorans]CAH1685565.1 Tryptophan-rich protein TspO [Chelatococcus asaccharovorans]